MNNQVRERRTGIVRVNNKMKRFLLTITTIILVIATGCSGRTMPSSTPTIEDIIATVSPAVVRIITQKSMGSGMIIDNDGYVLTNSHVVKDVTSVTIELSSGERKIGRIIGRDEINDLAILKIDGGSLSTVALGDSSKLRAGQEVIAIGFPLDLVGSVTVTKGIVSAIREYDLIQTDVAINPGNSGGPLINLKGEVIGVNFAGINLYRGITVQGMNFAVAINTAKSVIPTLKEGKANIVSSQTPTQTPTPTTISPSESRYALSINDLRVISSSISITGGTISLSLAPDANGKFANGSILNLNVTPTSGWQIERWSGTDYDSSTSFTNTVTMVSDKSVRVIFKKITYTLIIQTPSPSGAGTISPSPGSYSKNYGEVVTITATPKIGWQVNRWNGTGDDNSSSTSNKVTMNSDKSVSVLFKESIPTTVFTYSGTGVMNTPPFEASSSPWKLRYTVDWNGTFGIVVKGSTVVNQAVSAGQTYETYVYDITGSLYFSVGGGAPPNGHWTLSVIR